MSKTIGEIVQIVTSVVIKIIKHLPKSDSQKNPTKIVHEEDTELIMRHPCFNELSMWRNTKIHHVDISDPCKRAMTTAYIKIICDVCDNKMKLLDGRTIDELSEIFKPDAVTTTISEILHEINRKANLESIPTIFIEKTKNVLYEYLESMEETILDIQLYGRWYCQTDKILATLDVIYTTIRIVGVRIPSIASNMNGELSMALKGSKFDTLS